MRQNKHPLVLGVHPSSRGFGWALFEGPFAPFDWGTVHAHLPKNAQSFARFETLLDRYQPAVLAVEEFERPPAKRSRRIQRLYRTMIACAEGRGIEVHVYSRSAIRAAFAETGAHTREDIAHATAERIEILRPRLPSKRRIWMTEHPNLSLFNAAACALTYFANARN